MAKRNVSASRRAFLVSVGAGGVATAAAVVATAVPDNPGGSKEAGATARGGYKVSEHVNKYYRTARV